MAKKRPEPFWREARTCYFVQIGARQIRLDPDEDIAYRMYHELMARPPEKAIEVAPPIYVAEVLDQFLDWCLKNKAPRTYAWYRENLQRLVSKLPKGMKIAELKPFHVTRAMLDHWGNNTKHDFIGAAKRAFNWAVDEELIDRSPIARMKKPAREAREMAVAPVEYAEVMAAIKGAEFRALIEVAWETGARVQELRKVEARYVRDSRIVFPPLESKGKKYHRVVYLTARALAIVTGLAEKNPTGELFRNSEGNPWKKDAINSAFCRLQKKIGKKFHIGAFRKGYATEAMKKGVDLVGLAHLMGHRDPSMVSRVYAHVQQDPEYMAGLAEKARKPQDT